MAGALTAPAGLAAGAHAPSDCERLVFVVPELRYFLSHRMPLARAARAEGWSVAVAGPASPLRERLEDEGIGVHEIALPRSRNGPITEARGVLALARLYRAVRPTLVHHVAIKAVLYGSIAARFVGVPRVVNAIAGLGWSFTGDGLAARVARFGVTNGFRYALAHPRSLVIFQNPDDRATFVDRGVVAPDRVTLIRGAGVDIDTFVPTPVPTGIPIVLTMSRMLRDKGIVELVAASALLRERGVRCRMVLCGDPDPGNPTSIDGRQLDAWVREGLVEWWGHRSDQAAVLVQSTIVALPSYREGLPKALIEAAAAGRPIVTTDVPGCRDVVRHGVNGLLVPARDAGALADAIARLLADREGRERMGAAGREIAVREFSEAQVVAQTMRVYRELLGSMPDAP
jgi:glycosyltransferase involved in cell wall biosynthesis